MEVKGINNVWGISIPKFKVFLSNPLAVFPEKSRASDIGFDLTIISIFEKFPSGVVLYDTGKSKRISEKSFNFIFRDNYSTRKWLVF